MAADDCSQSACHPVESHTDELRAHSRAIDLQNAYKISYPVYEAYCKAHGKLVPFGVFPPSQEWEMANKYAREVLGSPPKISGYPLCEVVKISLLESE